jgi:hypothetical protein
MFDVDREKNMFCCAHLKHLIQKPGTDTENESRKEEITGEEAERLDRYYAKLPEKEREVIDYIAGNDPHRDQIRRLLVMTRIQSEEEKRKDGFKDENDGKKNVPAR